VSCHPVSSLLLVLFFCCKRFEWRQVSKKSKTIWGINYCCQTNPPFLSQQLDILTIMLN
jgi:hypothetical protein